jgi:hypothetical protein
VASCACLFRHNVLPESTQRSTTLTRYKPHNPTTLSLKTTIKLTPDHKGLGLFASRPAEKGSFLCLYSGELLSSPEATRRWRARRDAQRGVDSGRGNYILTMRENDTVVGHVDATRRANIG